MYAVAATVVFVLFRLTVFLRLPLTTDVICDPDVGGAAYSSQFLTQPGSIYANAVETKPPGTYFLFHFLFTYFGKTMAVVSGFTIAYHVLCMLAIFAVGWRLTNLAGATATAFFYTTYSVVSMGNGLCANFETWTLLPTICLFLLLQIAYSAKVQRAWMLIGAGVLASTAVMFKQQAAMHVIMFGLAIIEESMNAPRNRKVYSVPKAVAFYVAGGIGATIPVMAFFAAHGGLAAMIDNLNPSNYVGYASTEGWGFLNIQFKDSLLPFLQNTRTLWGVALLGIIPLPTPKGDDAPPPAEGKVLLRAYIFASFLAVFAGTKFFDHYYMLLIPALAVMAGRWVGRIFALPQVHWALKLAAFAVIFPTAGNDIRVEFELAAKAKEMRGDIGQVEWTEESDFFWRNTPVPRYSAFSDRAKHLGECLREHASADDTIYVWDYIPQIYFYSGLNAPTRHFMYFDVATDLPRGSGRWHVSEDRRVLRERERLIRDLEEHKPRYIVTFDLPPPPPPPDEPPEEVWVHIAEHAPLFEELKEYVDENYTEADECESTYFVVLKRKGTS
ncbi:glycosyltransferase family 39 protein [bacterium]|nr:glycosyltransferase family 39 protein [bacterium]